jgi:phage-related protein
VWLAPIADRGSRRRLGGQQPDDYKPLLAVGRGVEELRVRVESGTYRVIYTARTSDAVYVLHCFQKKTQVRSKREIEIARERFSLVLKGLV